MFQILFITVLVTPLAFSVVKFFSYRGSLPALDNLTNTLVEWGILRCDVNVSNEELGRIRRAGIFLNEWGWVTWWRFGSKRPKFHPDWQFPRLGVRCSTRPYGLAAGGIDSHLLYTYLGRGGGHPGATFVERGRRIRAVVYTGNALTLITQDVLPSIPWYQPSRRGFFNTRIAVYELVDSE